MKIIITKTCYQFFFLFLFLLLFLFLWLGLIGSAQAKIICNTTTWNNNTHIYQLNVLSTNSIQIKIYTPQGSTLKLLEEKNIFLAEQIVQNIADLSIVHQNVPILLILTTTGHLVGINIQTQNELFCQPIIETFATKASSKTSKFEGNLQVEYDKNNRVYILVITNSKPRGIIWIALPNFEKLYAIKDLLPTSFMPAPEYVTQIIAPVKTFNTFNVSDTSELVQQNHTIFAKVATLIGNTIWTLKFNGQSTESTCDMLGAAIQEFILLDLQQQHAIDALAMHNNEQLKIIPYSGAVKPLVFSDYIITGHNIRKVIIGPAIIEQLLSWYLIEFDETNYLLRSNNFANLVQLPRCNNIYLKHNVLVLYSLDDDQIMQINCRTGTLQQLQSLTTAIDGFNVIDVEKEQEYLFWAPKLQQHVLLYANHGQFQTKAFALPFDKPQILSWRKIRVE